MGEQFIVTQLIGRDGSSFYAWEYDLTKPRLPEAADPRMRYEVKRLVGVYRTRAKADQACAGEGSDG